MSSEEKQTETEQPGSQDVAVSGGKEEQVSSEPPKALPEENPSPPESHKPDGFAMERLTPERRQQIRQQLLESQRNAREQASGAPALSSPVATSPAAANTIQLTQPDAPPFMFIYSPSPSPSSSSPSSSSGSRESLLAAATSFLQSPNVRSAPQSRQIAFLEKKGLTNDEIDTVFKRAGLTKSAETPKFVEGIEYASPSSAHRPVSAPTQSMISGYPQQPVNPYVLPQYQQPLPIVIPAPVPNRAEQMKNVALAVILGGGGIAGLYLLVKRVVLASWLRFRAMYTAQLKKRQDAVLLFVKKVVSLCQLYRLDGPNEDGVTASSKTLPAVVKSSIDTTSARLDELNAALAERMTRVKSRSGASEATDDSDSSSGKVSIKQLRDATEELAQMISQETYFTPSSFSYYSNYSDYSKEGGGSSVTAEWVAKVNDVKSQIRSLKGMLLSRRNFPMPGQGPNGVMGSAGNRMGPASSDAS
ncbi:peroxisomal membrane protein pex14 [Borealophlyctis nickersoniae]|nr:peroxisomal membrane protein pex14 [Borealophlyctis nickersoniae]